MSEVHRYDLFSGDRLLTPEHPDSHRCRDGEWVQYESHARIVADLRAALAKAEAEREATKATVRDREAEILRIQTHETAAAHALDSTLTPEERAKFKELADENALLKARAERLAADRAALMRAIDDVARFVVIRGMVSEEYYAANKRLHEARAAVDAAGDLEAKP